MFNVVKSGSVSVNMLYHDVIRRQNHNIYLISPLIINIHRHLITISMDVIIGDKFYDVNKFLHVGDCIEEYRDVIRARIEKR